MKQTLKIHELNIPMHIGVNDWEKSILQTITFSIDLILDVSNAMRSDNLHETIDYTEVAALITKVSLSKHFDLVEHLAFEVHKSLKKYSDKIVSIRVAVKKKGVIPDSDSIEFILEGE